MNSLRLRLIVSGCILASFAGNAQTLYVSSGFVGEFDATTGIAINRTFITGLNGGGGALVVSGNTLFVAGYISGTVGKYDATTGAAINANFITGLSSPTALALSGNTLFVANQTSSTVGTYDATSGVAINASFITGLSSPSRLAVSDNILFVLNGDVGPNAYTIGEYDFATGRQINSLPPLNPDVTGLAVSGNVLYLADFAIGVAGGGSVGTYNATTGAPISPNFITGLSGPEALAVSGNTLYVSNLGPWPTAVPNLGTVGKYDATTGTAVNATLIGALNGPVDIAVSGPAQIPSAQSFNLTLQVSPATAGTIAATPVSSSGTYASGTRVCLSASASSGWAFQSWAGSMLDSTSCLVMDSDKTVTAIFAPTGGTTPPNPPSIQVSSIPQFGASAGSISGIVSGVSPAGYQVAPMVFLTGEGWFSKPTCDQTTVPLGQDGSFTALLTTGGADPFATKIALLVLATSVSVPCYTSVGGIPSDLFQPAVAQLVINRPNPNEREIQFAGQSWAVKASPIGPGGPVPIGPGEPNGCVYSDSSDNVSVDSQGSLHLKITNSGGSWSCAEVYSRAAVGLGRISWTIEGLPTLDPTSVLGMFTWADAESNARELDVEIGFSKVGDSTVGQFVVQPARQAGNLQRISLPTSTPITFEMTWLPQSLSFQAFDNSGNKVADWTYAGSVPPADRAYENFRFNLWLNGGPPASGQAQEAVISGFQYEPFVVDPTAPASDGLVNGASFVPGSSPGGSLRCWDGTSRCNRLPPRVFPCRPR